MWIMLSNLAHDNHIEDDAFYALSNNLLFRISRNPKLLLSTVSFDALTYCKRVAPNHPIIAFLKSYQEAIKISARFPYLCEADLSQIFTCLSMFFSTELISKDPASTLALFMDLIYPLSVPSGWSMECKNALSPLFADLLVFFEDSLLSHCEISSPMPADEFIDEMRYKLLLLNEQGINDVN